MMAPRVNAATRRGLLHSGRAGDAKDGERFLDSLGRRDPSCARRLFFSMEGVLGILTDNVNHPAHYEAGPFECVELTRARRAVERRIALLESDYSDDELRLLDGWSAPPAAMWRLRARGMEL